MTFVMLYCIVIFYQNPFPADHFKISNKNDNLKKFKNSKILHKALCLICLPKY